MASLLLVPIPSSQQTLGTIYIFYLSKFLPLVELPNRHRLRTAREQLPSCSEKSPPTVTLSRPHEDDGPQPSSVVALRCQICHGRPSVSYHRKHFSDPIAFPAVGICSRRRTKCKLYSTRWDTPAIAIPELPAD